MAVSSDVIRSKVNSASFLSISIRADCYASKENSHFLKKETSKDISEMAFQFLKIICSESWVKEKCLKDVDQFNTNLLVSFSNFGIFDHLVAPVFSIKFSNPTDFVIKYYYGVGIFQISVGCDIFSGF